MLRRVSYRSKLKYFALCICTLWAFYLTKDFLRFHVNGNTTNKSLDQPVEHLRTSELVRSTSRHLLVHAVKPTCTMPAILEFPNDFMNNNQRREGGFLVCVVVALYMFWAIAIVCDDYFVPALDVICERLNLQSDVAGATFMALGSSAPELFASVIGVFITEGDIGTGTILGSALFNVLFVIGICGLFSGHVLKLSWWPIVRDLMSYLIALITLILVIMDDVVMWYEAIIMMCFYSLYLITMYFNPCLERYAYRITNTVKEPRIPEHHLGYTGLAPARDVGEEETCAEHHHKQRHDMEQRDTPGVGNEDNVITEDENEVITQKDDDDAPDDEKICELQEKDTTKNFVSQEKRNSDEGDDCCDDDDNSEFDVALGSPLRPPKGKWKKICWSLGLPINLCFYCTIPDVRKKTCRKYYPITFVVCIVWIAITSYILVWMVALIGFTFGVPDTVMGLTLVAFGSSVPDCMSSLFVAKKGDGDMACSHTVGSNVFDILLCLGIPWTVKTAIFETRSSIVLNSHGLFISSFFIMASILVTFLMMHFHGWKLTKKVGCTYLIVYLIFISIACIIELNVFGDFNPPMCKISGSV